MKDQDRLSRNQERAGYTFQNFFRPHLGLHCSVLPVGQMGKDKDKDKDRDKDRDRERDKDDKKAKKELKKAKKAQEALEEKQMFFGFTNDANPYGDQV